ncbi:MAG TPA: hypothetical protein VL172_07585, partial [Kofleriaceae bacterium]|nr:hypothetical protein [Kofleriaceae bacterium]
VEKGGQLLKELHPEVAPGQELRRMVGETLALAEPAPTAAPAPVPPPPPPPPPPPAAADKKPEEKKKPVEDKKKPPVDDKKVVADDKKPSDNDLVDPRKPADGGAAATEDSGYLIANTTPWARVWIDGHDTGRNTPIAKRSAIKLKPGKHSVWFVVGAQKFKRSIVVSVGETVKLIEDLPVKE